MVIVWLLYGYCMVIVWLLYGYYMVIVLIQSTVSIMKRNFIFCTYYYIYAVVT
jgi:hypothetical protein